MSCRLRYNDLPIAGLNIENFDIYNRYTYRNIAEKKSNVCLRNLKKIIIIIIRELWGKLYRYHKMRLPDHLVLVCIQYNIDNITYN